MNKQAIKNFAVQARVKLISAVKAKAALAGITEGGIAEPNQSSAEDLKFFDNGTDTPYRIQGKDIRYREILVDRLRREEKKSDYKTAYQSLMEEAAYTWFNRMAAVRFMEVNGYLPGGVRVISSERAEKREPDIVTRPFESGLDFTPEEETKIRQWKQENQSDELFRFLFIRECERLGELLPGLFAKGGGEMDILFPLNFTDPVGVLRRLITEIPEEDFDVKKGGQVEIIGWLYQYYNTELKDEVFALLAKNVKVTKERLPAATQLFTPDWIVRYMVENSLGRLWQESHPDEELKSNWKYYLEEAPQTEEVRQQQEKTKIKIDSPEDIRFIDPCMGSGHILVYAFDLLMQIYQSVGYSPRDAAQKIIEKNLFGLDIDERAYQLAYFAVMMKGREYSRRILEKGLSPNVFAVKNSEFLTPEQIQTIAGKNKEIANRLTRLKNAFADGDHFGSLITAPDLDYSRLKNYCEEWTGSQKTLFQENEKTFIQNELLPFIKTAEAMAQKYDAVVTNPPYMGGKGMNVTLSDFVKKQYPDSKGDLFAACIERCCMMTNKNSYTCLVTMQSWMFLLSFETLRKKLLEQFTITNLMHMENMVLGIAFGTAVTIFKNTFIKQYRGTYNYIKAGDVINSYPKNFPVKKNRFIQISTENFSKIPGSPIAYWVGGKLLESFENGTPLGEIADSKQGLATADNGRFLRLWYETVTNRICFNARSEDEAFNSKAKWFPYNKRGEYRKWYGNNDYVVNWQDRGIEIRNFKDKNGKLRSRPQNIQYYFRESFSWSSVSSGVPAFRYKTIGQIFDTTGMYVFSELTSDLYYLLALCNTPIVKIILEILTPTIHYSNGDVANIPVIQDESSKEKIVNLTEQNIALSKTDWDSFETSWDFVRHPLVRKCSRISEAFTEWENECTERFNRLKANEEELNRIFIDIYGLGDELSPEVEDKYVSIAKADRTRDIKSFLSYAVGCLFGRYSLDYDGLAFAGGDWDDSRYKTVTPDDDNIIPIMDEDYFPDDLTGRFIGFLSALYGAETLEENLTFIAESLGKKGTSREVIRNYFMNDFYKDHAKMYKKRPIYWLFTSGKQNGFKALVYLHRYNPDTVAKLRVDYLHNIQRTYEREIQRMKLELDSPQAPPATRRRLEKLQKQLVEVQAYDEKIAALANARIPLDLDDGVKVNYDKLQSVNGQKFPVLEKIG